VPTPQVLPTTVVGSYALPPWLYAAKELIQAGRFGKRDIQETLEDATVVAIHDQTQAGVDVISSRRSLLLTASGWWKSSPSPANTLTSR
jgi:methionine synthase II (cobalamin-independent)